MVGVLRRAAQSLVGASNDTSTLEPFTTLRRTTSRRVSSTSWIMATSNYRGRRRTTSRARPDLGAQTPARWGSGTSNETLADGVGHRVGAVAQVQTHRDVLDHVLDRPFRITEVLGHFRCVETLGNE